MDLHASNPDPPPPAPRRPTCRGVSVVRIRVVRFDVGRSPGILAALLINFSPTTVNIAIGLARLESELEDGLRVLGAKRWHVRGRLRWPWALAALATLGAMARAVDGVSRGVDMCTTAWAPRGSHCP